MTRTKDRPIAIDLFCGVGGMSLGFEQAGFDVVAAFDLELRNVETHKKNFPRTRAFALNLAEATGREIRRLAGVGNRTIDVLFGGPPCQGFSVGGRRDLHDPRNLLVYHFARLVRELRPKYFVVENVEGLLMGHALDVVKSFRRRIRLSGYDVVEPIKVLNAADFGVPQRRRRTFILGHRKNLPPPSYPDPCGLVDEAGTEYFPTVGDALGDLPDIDRHDYLFDTDIFRGRLRSGTYYARFLRCEIADPLDKSHPRKRQRTLLTACLRTRHSSKTVVRFDRTPAGSQEPISHFFRLDAASVAPTIRAGTGSDRGSHTAPRPIHSTKPRCITVREAARLHSFPDWFTFHPTKWHGFRQVGNAVPPLLARAVANEVVKLICA